MACKKAPNGKNSRVFKEIEKNYNFELAEDAFYTMHNSSFRKWFKDWRHMADSLIEYKKDSLKSLVVRAQQNMS